MSCFTKVDYSYTNYIKLISEYVIVTWVGGCGIVDVLALADAICQTIFIYQTYGVSHPELEPKWDIYLVKSDYLTIKGTHWSHTSQVGLNPKDLLMWLHNDAIGRKGRYLPPKFLLSLYKELKNNVYCNLFVPDLEMMITHGIEHYDLNRDKCLRLMNAVAKVFTGDDKSYDTTSLDYFLTKFL